MATLTQMIEEYQEGPAKLRKAVAGMTAEQLRARPVAGKWSTLEVLCHLADFDPILADRMKRIIALDKPPLIGADETRFAAALAYHDRDAEEELAIIDKRAPRWRGSSGRSRPMRSSASASTTSADR